MPCVGWVSGAVFGGPLFLSTQHSFLWGKMPLLHSLSFLWGCLSQGCICMASGVDPWPQMSQRGHLFPMNWLLNWRHTSTGGDCCGIFEHQNPHTRGSTHAGLSRAWALSNNFTSGPYLEFFQYIPFLAWVTQGWFLWLTPKNLNWYNIFWSHGHILYKKIYICYIYMMSYIWYTYTYI